MISEVIRYLLITSGIKKVSSAGKTADVVVSMTTLPERVNRIKPTLLSLIDQTIKPKKILVWIPKSFKRTDESVSSVQELANLPLVEVRFIEQDLGPITKLIPSLKEHWDTPEQRIVCADDDIIYSKVLIEDYEQHSRQHDCALCVIGYQVPQSLKDKDRFSHKVYGNRIREVKKVDAVTGYGSFMIKPKYFDDQFLEEERPEQAFFTDDLVISANLSKEQVDKLVIPVSSSLSHLKRLSSWSTLSLSNSANKDGANNEFVMSHYKAYWHHGKD